MKKIILSAILVSSLSFTQHLPLKIGNQWHYDPTAVPGGTKYAAIVVDTTIINNKTYYQIERRHAFTGELLATTFDRLEGDTTYYRIENNVESIIINFNWPEGFTRTTTTDSICFSINLLWNIAPGNFWGFTTDYYQFRHGWWCIGDPDTSWALFISEITRLFGCRWAGDGRIEGAIIDGITFGTLYPLPVELIKFQGLESNGNIFLTWNTLTETNNRGFEILRGVYPVSNGRQNDNNWQTIGFVDGQGTTTEPQFYSFIDNSLQPGNYQYRLKQIDFDGSFEYSKVIEVKVKRPTEFSLSQNYPNPFNPSTVISYQLPVNSDVTLKIYDVLGNEITRLVDEYKPAGKYEIEFKSHSDEGQNLSSGIYFYQLLVSALQSKDGKTGSFIQTKKMVLIR